MTATEHTLVVEQCGVPVRVTLDGSGSATLAVPDPVPMFLTVTVYVIGLPGTTGLPLPAVSVLTTVKSGTGFVTVDEQPASAVLQGPVVMVAVFLTLAVSVALRITLKVTDPDWPAHIARLEVAGEFPKAGKAWCLSSSVGRGRSGNLDKEEGTRQPLKHFLL